MPVRLVMTQGGRSYALDLPDGTYIIGRDPDAGLVIPDGSVSGRHGEISVSGNLVQLRDLGSSNGTWVNGFRLHDRGQRLVSEVDRLRIGGVDLAIELLGEAANQAPVFVAPVVGDPEAESETGALPSLFTFRGRIGRLEYWVVMFLLTPPMIFLARMLGFTGAEALSSPRLPPTPIGKTLAIAAVALVLAWFALCATAKRWHDRDKSAWWLLLAIVPLAVQFLFVVRFGLKSTPSVLSAAVLALALTWNLVDLGMMGGTMGRNRYGSA